MSAVGRLAGIFAFGTAATLVLFACTLTRNLDYLTDGKPDAAGSSSGVTPHEGGTTTSSSGTVDSGPVAGEIIASKQYDPVNLVQDADSIYWTTDDNQVLKLAKTAPAGTAPQQLTKLAGDVNQIRQAVVDVAATGNVYLLLDAVIKAVPKAGGAATDFVTILPPPTLTQAIAADDTAVFVLYEIDPDNADMTQLSRYPKATPTAPVTMSTLGTAPTTMVLSGDTVLWAATETSTDGASNLVLYELPKAAAGIAPKSYKNTAQSQGAAIGIAPTSELELFADATNIYWIDDQTSATYKQARSAATGAATTLVTAKNSSLFHALAVDGQSVYLTTDNTDSADTNTLIKLAIAGGQPTEFTVQPNPTEIVVDDKAVYVAFNGAGNLATNGGILRITK